MEKDQIQIKRVYQDAEKTDGFRVLVDRLWPRGMKKTDLQHDLWLKDVSPSGQLRKWVHEDKDRWAEFIERYRAELNDETAAVGQLLDKAKEGRVTLLYAGTDPVQNNAAVLRDYLLARAT